MSDTQQPTTEEVPEPQHLEVVEYDDSERVSPPDWYEGDTQ